MTKGTPEGVLFWQVIFWFYVFYLPLYFTDALRGPHLSLHVFTCRSTEPTTSGGAIVLFCVFTGRSTLLATSVGTPRAFASRHPIFRCTFLPAALLYRRPPGRNLSVFRIYRHSLFGRPSGGHIFLCVKKDMEERHAKGLQSRPLESCFYTGAWRGDVRASYEFALVQLTRFRPVRGVLRTASTDSIVLHVMQRNCWNLKNNQTDL